MRPVMRSQLMLRSLLVGVLLRLLLLQPFSSLFPVVSEVLERIQGKEELDTEMRRGVADADKSLNGKVWGARVSATVSASPRCKTLAGAEPLALHSGGDVLIGGLFPLHYVARQPLHSYRSKPQPAPCSGFDHRAFRWMMTMVFAVEEINRNSSLLPGLTLGYRILDSCDNIHTSLRALLSLLSHSESFMKERQAPAQGFNESLSNLTGGSFKRENQADHLANITEETMNLRPKTESVPSCITDSPISAVIGLASSSPTRAVAHTLGPLSIPLLSYFATCTCLTDKKVYPSFLRTVPSDLFQVRGLVQLVTFFGWFWVGTIGTTDDYSRYGIQSFSKQLRLKGGCLAFQLTVPKSPTADEIREMADTLQGSSARVVVVFASEGQLLELFLELAHRNVTGIQWVASEAWVTAGLLTSSRFQRLLEGTLGFSFPGVRIPGLAKFLLNIRPNGKPGMEFINMFWEEKFGCRLKPIGVAFKENRTDGRERDTGFGEFGSKSDFQDFSSRPNGDQTNEKPFCTGSEDLRATGTSYSDMSHFRISYNIYKAVYVIAHALHRLLKCDSTNNSSDICVKHQSFTSKQLLHHIRTVNFTNQFDEKVYFDSNGEPVPLYDIINWQKDRKNAIRFVKVGNYDGSSPSGRHLLIEYNNIVWADGQSEVPVSRCSAPCAPGTRQARRPGQPRCCFDCLPCADGEISNHTDSTECHKCPQYYWPDADKVKCSAAVEEFLSTSDAIGIVLVTLTLLGVLLTVAITLVFHRYRSTPIVKANNSEISFLLLLSLKLCFLCSLAFIGRPATWTCRFRQAAFGISFVLCLSCLLVKTIVVLFAFRTCSLGHREFKLFGPSQQRALIFCTTAPQVCLCAGWLLGAPPFTARNPTYQASTGKIVVECKEPWPYGFYLVLGYIGFLAFLCLFLAFLGRKLPNTFNEAKLITFSMLIFWAVWVSFIPAYISSPGKFAVAVEVFAILASSFGLLFCIFGPKCHILLLRPDKNTKRGITGKYRG